MASIFIDKSTISKSIISNLPITITITVKFQKSDYNKKIRCTKKSDSNQISEENSEESGEDDDSEESSEESGEDDDSEEISEESSEENSEESSEESSGES